MAGRKRWLPLESNPEVLNQFVQGLGFIPDAEFVDVYGFDDELLAMIPRPVLALLFVFPIAEKSEASLQEEHEGFTEEGQKVSSNVYFMRQTVHNACGTIGILHAVGNNLSQTHLTEGSYLENFFQVTSHMTPEEKAAYLETDEEIEGAHSVAATAGDTIPPDANAPVDLHFSCFVVVDGGLYELDGRKRYPIYHGLSSSETFLEDAIKVIKEFVERMIPNSLNCNVIALAKIK